MHFLQKKRASVRKLFFQLQAVLKSLKTQVFRKFVLFLVILNFILFLFDFVVKNVHHLVECRAENLLLKRERKFPSGNLPLHLQRMPFRA